MQTHFSQRDSEAIPEKATEAAGALGLEAHTWFRTARASDWQTERSPLGHTGTHVFQKVLQGMRVLSETYSRCEDL